MYIIGLTGNIATGKSTVMHILGELGAQVIDADLVAHEVMRPGGSAYLKVIGAFGDSIVSSDGAIDRRQLGAMVFSDSDRLQVLERIIHPLVVARIGERLKESQAAIVVVEAIKLLESGLNTLCNEIWVVTSPRTTQIKRLKDTRGLKRSDALMRIDAQPPQAEKVKAANVVIHNTGSLEDLRARVEQEWARIVQAVAAQTS
jgi:dephospho-CoA kinase